MNTKNKIALAGLEAVIAGAGYTAYKGANSALEERAYYQDLATRKEIKQGSIAPDFTLKSLDGKEITLSKLEGKLVLLDFWATWCGPCQALTPHIKKLYEECKEDGLEVIQIATQNTEKDLEKYIKHNTPPFTIFHDKDNKLWRDYNLEGIPDLFLIENGKVKDMSHGYGTMSLDLMQRIKKEIKKKR